MPEIKPNLEDIIIIPETIENENSRSDGDIDMKFEVSHVKKEEIDTDMPACTSDISQQLVPKESVMIIQDTTTPDDCVKKEMDSKMRLLTEKDTETLASETNFTRGNLKTKAKTSELNKKNKIQFKRLYSQIKSSQNKRFRPRKKARMELIKEKTLALANPAIDEILDITHSSEDEAKDDIEYCLTVTNLPNSWSFMDIKNYIDTQCGPVDEIEMIKDDKTGNGAIRLSYQIKHECEKAMEKLKDKEIEGTKLIVSMNVVNLDISEVQPDMPQPAPSNARGPEVPTNTKPWRPDLDIWDIDPKGLYGLKYSFLNSLGIKPPIDKWVHVYNFRCDKAELRDVLELAGNVLMCTVFVTAPKYASVMYSHPLEAVQAVSMLNGQKFYGTELKVAMHSSPSDTIILPKGLSTIGAGLGANGKPIWSILNHYHRYVTNKTASINRKAFKNPQNLDEYPNGNTGHEEKPFTVINIEDFVISKDASTAKPVAASKATSKANVPSQPAAKNQQTVQNIAVKTPTPARKPSPAISPIIKPLQAQNFQPRNLGQNVGQFGPRPGWSGPGPDPRMAHPFGPGPRPVWNGPGPIGQMGPMGPMGPMAGPMPGPMQGPMRGPMPRPMPGPMMGQMMGPRPMPGPMGPMFPGGNEPVQLQFFNLPPSTTFAILCEKMAACGQVVSIQLTTPGCAVVTFANRMQADICFRQNRITMFASMVA